MQDTGASTPRSALTSPEPPRDDEKRKSIDASKQQQAPQQQQEQQQQQQQGQEEEVEALSEMMCSLVTNTSGETRYIGKSRLTALPVAPVRV